jgi:hypothetical protein
MLTVEDSGESPRALAGFDNLEAGLVLLSQPTRGFYFRRDGALGTCSIWHDRLRQTMGRVSEARYGLLQDLDMVTLGDRSTVHSVLIQPNIDFTIYLPPQKVGVTGAG